MTPLTADEIRQYREEGWLVPKFRLAPERLARLRVALDELIACNPTVRPEKLVSAHVVMPEGRPNAEGVRGHPAFFELANDPAILDCVEALIGPDTVDTVPDATMAAFADHGQAARTLDAALPEARATLAAAARCGIGWCAGRVRADGTRGIGRAFRGGIGIGIRIGHAVRWSAVAARARIVGRGVNKCLLLP